GQRPIGYVGYFSYQPSGILCHFAYGFWPTGPASVGNCLSRTRSALVRMAGLPRPWAMSRMPGGTGPQSGRDLPTVSRNFQLRNNSARRPVDPSSRRLLTENFAELVRSRASALGWEH